LISGRLVHQNIDAAGRCFVAARVKATEILAGKRHSLDALAEALMKEEILERADVERIIQGVKV
jgi:ATP-dependent Zn protease